MWLQPPLHPFHLHAPACRRAPAPRSCPRGCPQPLLESSTAPATASSPQQHRQGPAPAANSARSPPRDGCSGGSSGAGRSGSGAGSAHARWGRSRTSGRRWILRLLCRCAGDREGGAGLRWHLLSFLSSVLDAGIAERPPLFFSRFFFKILFIYLTQIETASERGNTSRGSGRGRSRLLAEEPDVGLDPGVPGSRPEPKADT